MRCDEFEQRWQAALDRQASGEPDPLLEGHAATCPACRDLQAGFRILVGSLAAGAPRAHAPEGLASRIVDTWNLAPVSLAMVVPPRNLQTRKLLRRIAGAAAALLVLATAAWMWLIPHGERPTRPGIAVAPPRVAPTPSPELAPPAPISRALADATAATVDLARSTSAPAARVGRLVLASARREEPAAAASGSADQGETPRARGDLRGTLHDRVRPLAAPARSAFGFLLGPAAPKSSSDVPRERDA